MYTDADDRGDFLLDQKLLRVLYSNSSDSIKFKAIAKAFSKEDDDMPRCPMYHSIYWLQKYNKAIRTVQEQSNREQEFEALQAEVNSLKEELESSRAHRADLWKDNMKLKTDFSNLQESQAMELDAHERTKEKISTDFGTQTVIEHQDVATQQLPDTSDAEVQFVSEVFSDPPLVEAMEICSVQIPNPETTIKNNGDPKPTKRKSSVKLKSSQPKGLLPVQCFNCQKFGHYAKTCTDAPSCVKCGDHHDSRSCTKPKDVSPRCANCNQDHTGNFKGCSFYKDFKKKTTFSKKTKRKSSKPSTRTIKPSPQPEVNSNITKTAIQAMMATFQQMFLLMENMPPLPLPLPPLPLLRT